MLVTAFVICIVVMSISIWLYNRRPTNYEAPLNIAIAFGTTAGFLAFLIIVLTCINGNGRTASEKIAMYEEENTRIEEQIAVVVKQYQEYEIGVFSEVKVDSAVTYVSLYPELKSDTLVQSQIAVYTANNEKIKELHEREIDYDNFLWWLYFGGK
jgi:hypothetical protein